MTELRGWSVTLYVSMRAARHNHRMEVRNAVAELDSLPAALEHWYCAA
jgi:hypothetical protein